jgi:hypothetical protein
MHQLGKCEKNCWGLEESFGVVRLRDASPSLVSTSRLCSCVARSTDFRI